MRKQLFCILSVFFWGITCTYSATDTLHVYFKLNEEKLQAATKNKLDSLLYNDVINNGTSVLIVGYADYLGSTEHNQGLSERRAKAIQDYLISMQMPQANIKLCIGKGEVSRNLKLPDGYAPDRRVDIVLSKMKGVAVKPKKSLIKVTELPAAKTNSILPNIKVGQTVRLSNIYFVMGRHVVTEESYPELDKLFETLEDNPNLKIQIEGHICCLKRGFDAEDDDTHEHKLSVNRAKFIYEYLIRKGIDKDRLRYLGLGRSRPLVSPELSAQDEDMNRRVEIRVLEK